MRLTFYVAPRQDGAFLRDVLRQNGVSAALSASVKHSRKPARGGGRGCKL